MNNLAPDLQFLYYSDLNPAGKVLEYNGQTAVTMDSVAGFPVSGLTVSFWVKNSGSENGAVLFSYDARPDDMSRRLWLKNPENLEAGFGDAETGPTGVTLTDQCWHHLALTVQPSDPTHFGIQLYKDGMLMFQGWKTLTHPPGEFLESGGKLELGFGTGPETNFRGQMSEFRLRSEVQSAADMITEMERRLSVTAPGMVICWALDSPPPSVTITNGQFVASDLQFRNPQLLARWNEITGATYDLEVEECDGCYIYKQSNLTECQEIITGYLLHKAYQAKVMAVISGAPGNWSAPQTVRILNLRQVTPKIEFTPQTLTTTWPAVDQAQSYQIIENGNGGPDEETAQPGTSFDLTGLAESSDSWQFRIKAFSEGAFGPESATQAAQTPSLDFNYQNDDGTGGSSFEIKCNNAQPNLSCYFGQIYKEAIGGTLFGEMFLTDTSYRIDNPEVQENEIYLARIRGIALGTVTSWSAAAKVTIHNLAAPQTGFQYDCPSQKVQFAWNDIRTQAQKDNQLQVTYEIEIFAEEETQPIPVAPASNLFYDLPDEILTGDHSYQIKVEGTAEGSLGPWSATREIQSPVISKCYYDDNDQKIHLEWTGISESQPGYMEVFKAGITSPDYCDFVTDFQGIAFSPAGLMEGNQYTPQLRAMATGYITKYSQNNPSVTIYKMDGPVVTSAVGDAATHTIQVEWQFNDSTPPQGSISYNIELWNSDQTQRLLSANTADQSYTFTDSNRIISGQTYQLRVQAQSGNSLGRWSQYKPVPVSALAGVTNIQITSDATAQITVNWSPSPESGVNYKVTIWIENVEKSTRQVPTTTPTTTTFTKEETGVDNNQTYKVKVVIWAIKGSEQSAPASEEQPITIGPGEPKPDPYIADPIGIATGSYSYSHLDLGINWVEPLRFIVYYHTYTPTPAESSLFDGKPLGNRWNHYYNTKIAMEPGGQEVKLLWGDGTIDTYQVPSSITGNYPPVTAPRGDCLIFGSDRYFILTKKDFYRYRFNAEGRLQDITSPAGNITTLEYNNNNQVSKILLNEQHYLELNYDEHGFLSSIQDHTGRKVTYYFENNNLKTVTNVLGQNRTFGYDEAGRSLLTTITDENGHTFVKNVYDEQKRVTFQQDAWAIAEQADYGHVLAYSSITEDNLEIVVTDYTDPAGNTARFKSFKSSNQLKNAVYQLGGGKIRRIDKTYDGFSNILTETVYEGLESEYPTGKGNTTTYTYDGANNLLTVIDPLGQVVSYTYDTDNHLLTLTDQLGNIKSFEYEANLLKRSVDFLQRATCFVYNDSPVKGLVETVTDVNSNTFQYQYANGYLAEMINPFGETTKYTNDGLGRVIKEEVGDQTGVVFKTTAMEYDDAGNLLTKAVSFQNQPPKQAFTYRYTYDNVGNLSTVTDPENNVMTYLYDPNDLLQRITYPSYEGVNRETIYEYDKLDHLQAVTYAETPNVKEQYTYDRFNRLLNFVDANGNNYQFNWDWPISPTGSFQEKQTLTFPMLSSIQPPEFTEELTKDAGGRLIQVKNRADQVFLITYDKESLPAGTQQQVVTYTLPPAEEGAVSLTVQEVYDALGRLISYQNEAGQITTIGYTLQNGPENDTQQTVITVTDPLGNQKIVISDALGRVVGYKEGQRNLFQELTYRYDALGRLIATGENSEGSLVETLYTHQFDPESKGIKINIGKPGDSQALSILEFNSSEQLVRETDPLNHSVAKTYTPWGGLASYTNARGQTFTFGYDNAGRFCKVTQPETMGEITHQLDGNGNRLKTLLDGQTMITRNFDEWNRLISRGNSSQQIISRDYTTLDQVQTLTYSDQKQVSYDYDNLGRLKRVTDWQQRSTEYQYEPAGKINQITYANGCRANLDFDLGGRLCGVEHQYQKDEPIIVIAKIQYKLDAFGNPQTSQAIYPIAPVIPTGVINFTYNAANQIDTINGQQLSYDDDGNLLALPVDGQMKNIQYDSCNRITACGDDTYAYDPDGLRVAAAINGAAQKFIYDINNYRFPALEMADPFRFETGPAIREVFNKTVPLADTLGETAPEGPFGDALDRLLEIRDADNNILYRYVYGQGLISQEGADGSYYVFHFNSNGSTLALTDSSGEITDKYAYDPYGKICNREGDTFNPFLYSGEYGVYDDGNGLVFMRARSYSPELLRFLQKDFLVGNLYQPQTLNRYAYVTGNPVIFNDPLGLGKDIAIALALLGILGAMWFESEAAPGGVAGGLMAGPLGGLAGPPGGGPPGGRPPGGGAPGGRPPGGGSPGEPPGSSGLRNRFPDRPSGSMIGDTVGSSLGRSFGSRLVRNLVRNPKIKID